MELNFTLLYFFAAGIASLPLPLLVRKRPLNIPVLVSAFWIIQNNLFLGINTIIWRGNVDKKMLVYCDIGEDTSNPNCSRFAILILSLFLSKAWL